jgi:cytoskeletal protein CcmA (bactofilin family)
MWGEKGRQKKEAIFGNDNYTFLGREVDISGKAKFEGTVRVDGRFEGEIITDDTLIIGEQAVVKGSIRGGTIISGGRIEATITATNKVQLLKSAVLIGDVHSPSFSMEEGVYFRGRCDMGAVPKTTVDMNTPQIEYGRPEDQRLEVC